MKSILLLFLFSTSFIAQAAPLDPESLLSRISHRLVGTEPTEEEYDKLAREMEQRPCSQYICLEDFFRKYVREKMKTSAFMSEAALKFGEHMAFQTEATLPFPMGESNSSSNDNLKQEDLLLYRVMSRNLSVDELYTSQLVWRIAIPDEVLKQVPNYEQNVGTQVITDTKPNKWTVVHTDDLLGRAVIEGVDYTGHPNIAGVFSGRKFLTRYWNTPVNNNRKRAAAVFKTMMCDAMSPSLERKGQLEAENNLAQGVTEAKVSVRDFAEIHKNRHANQKDCAACHSRLDPMAQSMRPLELAISPFAARGRLVFSDALNKPVELPADNFAGLIKIITTQQKYADCQLNWLFTWIVGRDVKVAPQRYAELMRDFERDKHRMRITIERLLLSPEFRDEEKIFETPALLNAAQNVFDNCQECHRPFLKTTGVQLKTILSKIVLKLDLPHDGLHRIMPPKDHYWAPDAQDLAAVKAWISAGAPLGGDLNVFTPNEVTTLMTMPNAGNK